MKKFFALALSLCLMLTAAAAFAETNADTAVRQIKWSDFEEKKPEGAMTVLDEKIGLKMYIPAQFIQSTLTEEQAAGGVVLLLNTEDQSAVVNAANMPLTLDAFLAGLANSGVTTTTEVEINGLKAVNFNVQTGEVLSTCVAMPTMMDTVLVFSFSPVNEANADMFRVMAASIQKAND